jgi:Family of unknown function (DUF5317)/Major Facilitator Superfamily
MFLLPSVFLGVVLALVLGGRPSRLLDLELRRAWAVWLALSVQMVLFTPLGDGLPPEAFSPLHVATYALLLFFAAANVQNLALLPLVAGMLANATAIVANGGKMPVQPEAWEAAGFTGEGGPNVRLGAERLGFLGDIFALPPGLPFTNVFSVGDLLIGLGAVVLIVTVSTRGIGDVGLAPSRLVQPIRSSSFRRLAVGKLVSHLGDWLTLAALVGWVYEDTQSVGQVAVLMLVRLAPPILGGGLAAALVDRLPKVRVLVAVELARGTAVAAACAGVLLEQRPLAFGAVAFSGMLAAVSAATVPALVPSLLEDEHLPAANAGLGIAQDVAMALGALAAGVVLSASTAVLALAVDFGTFVVAAVLYLGVRTVPGLGEASGGAEGEEDSDDVSLLGGLRYLLRRRTLVVVVGAFGTATLATGLTNATLPRLLDEGLGLGTGSYGFGLSALAWGLVAGQALVGIARVGPAGGRWFGVGLAAMAGLFVLLAVTEHAPTAVLVLGLIGLVDGTTEVLFDTIVQREANPRFYGRIFGFASAFFTATMMGAVAAAPLVNRIAPPQQVILAGGLALLAASAIALLGSGSRRTAEVRPQAAEEETRDEPERPLAPLLTLVPPVAVPPEPEPVVVEPAADSVRVVVRLAGGERLRIASFPDRAAAEACARKLVRSLSELETGEWPLVGNRFIRPEAIVSVDLVASQAAVWPVEDEETPEAGQGIGSL